MPPILWSLNSARACAVPSARAKAAGGAGHQGRSRVGTQENRVFHRCCEATAAVLARTWSFSGLHFLFSTVSCCVRCPPPPQPHAEGAGLTHRWWVASRLCRPWEGEELSENGCRGGQYAWAFQDVTTVIRCSSVERGSQAVLRSGRSHFRQESLRLWLGPPRTRGFQGQLGAPCAGRSRVGLDRRVATSARCPLGMVGSRGRGRDHLCGKGSPDRGKVTCG